MSLQLELQLAVQCPELPSREDFEAWVTTALEMLNLTDLDSASLCVRIVDEAEITELNGNYRNKSASTNVLSFAMETPEFIAELTKQRLLGDILMCAPVVLREASEQNISARAHWAHLTLHGLLHLLDYDHENESDAELMEGTEIAILNQLGFANPYESF